MFTTFIACLGTETNSFANIPTGMNAFAQTLLDWGDATQKPANYATQPLHYWREQAEAKGGKVVESLSAYAQPGGTTTRKTYEQLRDYILHDAKQAGQIDILLLHMHGAMSAQGYVDCEGDLLQELRAICGPDTIIGVELDLHCSITPAILDSANIVITFKEYPHIDVMPRAVELFDLAWQAKAGDITPHTQMCDTHTVNLWRTPQSPVKEFVAHMQELEQQAGILSVSFAHGFPWQDVPDTSGKILVVTDNQPELGASTAKDLAQQVWRMKEDCIQTTVDMPEALAILQQADSQQLAGPIVFGDVADNAGAGASSDSTFALAALIDAKTSDMAIGYIWDPQAVWLCEEGGIGATIQLRIGGKVGPESGQPVDVQVTVKAVVEEAQQDFGSSSMAMGKAIWVQAANNLDIVLVANRSQVLHPSGFANFGIDLSAKKGVVVKSMQHFYAGFEPLASEIYYLACGGAVMPDFANIPFQSFSDEYWPKHLDLPEPA